MSRSKLFLVVTAFGSMASVHAAGNKPPQVAEFKEECKSTLGAIRADWKARATLLKAQLDTIALQVDQGMVTPANALATVVTHINDTRAAILLDATEHCDDLFEIGKALVIEIGGDRPRDFQIGGGGVLDDFTKDLEAELEKARKKLESHVFAYRDDVFESTAGGFDHRFLLPKVPAPRVVAPGSTSSNGNTEWLLLPDAFLVLVGARTKSAPNSGIVHVAGRVTAIDAPQPLPEIMLFGAAAMQIKMNVPLGDHGIFQTVFTSLPSRDYHLRLEQDAGSDSIPLNAGLQLIELISVP